MRRSIIFAIALTLGMATAAKADFVIQGATGPQPSPSQPPGATPVRASEQKTNAGQPDQAPAPPPRIHWKIAQGFGDAVPLGFACRQIVPPAVKVTYGPGADPAMPVSWKGGDAWNDVLRDAVRPHGLRLVMRPTEVEIRK